MRSLATANRQVAASSRKPSFTASRYRLVAQLAPMHYVCLSAACLLQFQGNRAAVWALMHACHASSYRRRLWLAYAAFGMILFNTNGCFRRRPTLADRVLRVPVRAVARNVSTFSCSMCVKLMHSAKRCDLASLLTV